MKKYIVLSISFLFILMGLQAQEILLPLATNPALKPNQESRIWVRPKSGTALPLPFLDDFSYDAIYPDASKWTNNWAFVSRSFGPLPPSLGMVTLDAIDDTGAVYTFATPTPFLADSLTSFPLRLDSILTGSPDIMELSDSLYLSFFYQPQGYGNSPDEGDSLILEFFNPTENKWNKVWGASGLSYADFFIKYNVSFKLVMIPILDTMYLKDGFRFQFKNYASIANMNLPSWQSNMDQWNIDYIYLNYGRYKNDTSFADVTFVDNAPSILKNYMQMPARQYVSGELKDTLHLKMSNLNYILNNISYQYVVNEVGGPFTYTKLGGSYTINPFNTNGYHDWPFHTNPVVDFALPAMTGDSSVFEITHMIGINGWSDNIITNDTIKYRQAFYNFFAYDDGTAEAGYGLAGTGSRLAYQFTLNTPDTLGAVQMFFNQTYTPPNSRYFYLTVWESINPEKVIYKSKRVRPYVGDSLNAFHTYYITDTILMLNGTFYVGWQQITDEVLNIGFDENTNSSSKIYYNAEGTWGNTVYTGSLMLRPVFGTAGQEKKFKQPDGINDFTANLFPNPVNGDEINLLLPDKYLLLDPESTITIDIFNYLGALVMQIPYTGNIAVNELPNGFYFLRLNSFSTNESCVKTFVIAR